MKSNYRNVSSTKSKKMNPYQQGGQLRPNYNFSVLGSGMAPVDDSAIYQSNFNQMLKFDPSAMERYHQIKNYNPMGAVSDNAYGYALNMQNAYEDALNQNRARPTSQLASKAMNVTGRAFQEGGEAPQEQAQDTALEGSTLDQGQDQMQQVMQGIAQMLQQGMDPQAIMQKLVQSGVPQDQAQQLIQQVMQQMQGTQKRMGGYFRK